MSRRKTSSSASRHRRLSSRKKVTAVSWSVSSTEAKSLSRPGYRDAMEDFGGFASAPPEFCDPNAVRVPGHARVPLLDAARPFELSADSLSAYRVDAPKDPTTLPNMLKMGPEAVAFYVSFRVVPNRWGIYIREGGLRGLKEEYHRIIWRGLGKYADRNVDDAAEEVETAPVVELLRWSQRVRFAVEMANVLSRQPPGWKDFGKFLNRKTSVGATNYVRIQYSYNPEMLERGQAELSRRLSGGSPDTTNLFKAEVLDFPNVYLL